MFESAKLRVLRALCLTHSRASRASCPTCFRASRVSFPSCSCASRASCPTCFCASLALCFTCCRASSASCASRALVIYVPLVPPFSAYCFACFTYQYQLLCSCVPMRHVAFLNIYFQLVSCSGKFTTVKIKIVCRLKIEMTVSIN